MKNDTAVQAAHSVPSSGTDSDPVVYQLSGLALDTLPDTVLPPGYDRSKVTSGILHLGTGNFFLAHMASYVHDVLAIDPRWGIVATSIRTDGTINGLREQDGAYVLVVRENGERTPHVLAPVTETMFGPDAPRALMRRIAEPDIKLVTITVSNKGYCLKHGALDLDNEEILHDLANPDNPQSIYGYLAGGLKLRQDTGVPLTVMSLDNIEQNSKSLKTALLQYLEQAQPELVEWVKANVDFPVTLVDRITPEVTGSFREQMAEEIGFQSKVLVGTEAFRQLVVERSRFEMPPFDKANVQVVDDCSPYWARKFVLLNAGHQIVAIPGQRLGSAFVHEAAAREGVARLLARAHKEWLTFLPGGRAELRAYCASIRRRFADEALGDTVQRVAARATSKVSERLFASVEMAITSTGKLIKTPIFVAAIWLLNLSREDEFGNCIHLHDADAEKLQHVHKDVITWVRALEADAEATASMDKTRLTLLAISEALKDARFARLAANDAFVEEFAWAIVNVHRLGVEKAIDALLAR